MKVKTMIISTMLILTGCKEQVPQDSVLKESFKSQFPGIEMTMFHVKPTFKSEHSSFYNVTGNVKFQSPWYEIVDDLGFNSYLVKQSIAANHSIPFEITLTQNTDDKGGNTYQFGRLMPSITEELISKDALDSLSENYVVGNSDNLQQDIDKQFEFVKKIVEADYASLPKLMQERDELLNKLNLTEKKLNEYWLSVSIEGQSFQDEYDFYDYIESQREQAISHIDTKVAQLMEQYDNENYEVQRKQIFEQVQSDDEQYYEEIDEQREEVVANYQISFEDELDELLNEIDEKMSPYLAQYDKLGFEYSNINDSYYQILDQIEEITNTYSHLEETKQALTELIASYGFSVSK